jgi:signal peptidase II
MKRKYRILAICFFCLLALDQATKLLIVRHIPLHHAIDVIPGFFAIAHVENRGAAFGLLAHLPAAGTLFVVVSLIAILFICVYFRWIEEQEVWNPICLALILTGAVGNLIDRLRLGSVVDFLDVYYRGWHWPAFNVADSCITVGVLLLALKILWGERRSIKERA